MAKPQAPAPDARAIDEFLSVLRHFDQAMLVTLRDGALRSRPMAVAEHTDRGHLWFITRSDSGKLDELHAHAQVNVAMQQGARFLSISGRARLTRDARKIDEVWTAAHAVWFDKGRDDPQLVLIEVIPHDAEYWDRSGIEGVKFAFAMARSLATGERLDDDAAPHGKLHFGDEKKPAGS